MYLRYVYLKFKCTCNCCLQKYALILSVICTKFPFTCTVFNKTCIDMSRAANIWYTQHFAQRACWDVSEPPLISWRIVKRLNEIRVCVYEEYTLHEGDKFHILRKRDYQPLQWRQSPRYRRVSFVLYHVPHYCGKYMNNQGNCQDGELYVYETLCNECERTSHLHLTCSECVPPPIWLPLVHTRSKLPAAVSQHSHISFFCVDLMRSRNVLL